MGALRGDPGQLELAGEGEVVGSAAVAVLATALTVAPISSGLLSIDQSKVTINASTGAQQDPHVDGALAAYTNDYEIRYFSFADSSDQAIPKAPTDIDLLSDVNSGRIVFSRVTGASTNIMLFDTTAATPAPVEVAPPTSATTRFGASIGGNSLVFADYSSGSGEILHVDVSNPSVVSTIAPTNLTSDAINDQNPAVAPDGNVVAWERCQFSSSCDIYQRVRTGSTWGAATLVSADAALPDTNGALVVYERPWAGGATSDIFYRAVTGGAEAQLVLSGEEHNPTIGGSGATTVIAFESRATSTSTSDLFLYEVATNRLFQLMSTPENETLNDVTVLSDGRVRIVWQSDTAGDYNIYGATFSLPAASTCANRGATLTATKTYQPTRWADGSQTFSPAIGFAMPAEIPVTQGNSGNHWAILTVTSGSTTTMCKFRGGADVSHPSTPTQLAKATKYKFAFCTGAGMAIQAGTIVKADRLVLHVDNGDSWRPSTQIRLTLSETCDPATWPTPPPPPPPDDDDDDDDGHCGGHHGGHHGGGHHGGGHHGGGHGHHGGGHDGDRDDDDDDTSSSHHGLSAADPVGPETAGCSSAGGLAWPLVFLVMAMLLLRRHEKIRLVARREQRRLRG